MSLPRGLHGDPGRARHRNVTHIDAAQIVLGITCDPIAERRWKPNL